VTFVTFEWTYFTVLVAPYFLLKGFQFNPSLPADFMSASQASGRTCGAGECGTPDSLLSCLRTEGCHGGGFLSWTQKKRFFSVRRNEMLHWTFFLSNYSKTGPL